MFYPPQEKDQRDVPTHYRKKISEVIQKISWRIVVCDPESVWRHLAELPSCISASGQMIEIDVVLW